MPKPRFTDSDNLALVNSTIAMANAQASDDAEFVEILRSAYFGAHPLFRRRLPVASGRALTMGGARPLDAVGGDVAPRQTIYDDPRFLANVRALARQPKPNTRIIGGSNTGAREFPDCVALGGKARWGCSGTLIAPKLVLSAGHCSAVASRVFFGNDVSKRGKIVAVDRAVPHPDYGGAQQNDLMLLFLKKAASVRPRKLATKATIDKATSGRAVGFGHMDVNGSFGYGIKRQVDIPIASPSCSGKVQGKTDAGAYGCDRNLELVAGKPLLFRDTCNGDSGGPFYVKARSGEWVLAAATSRFTKGAIRKCGDGGIYVRVDQYREWIEDTAGIKLR
ncbi:MAG: S1 family peptidase [Gemmatimonadaceae bacterium]